MKKLLLLLFLIPNLVMGEEWIDVYKDGTIFVKKNSAERTDGKKIRFEMYQNVNSLSLRYYSEINCNEQSIKDLNLTYFSEEHLKGEILKNDGPNDKLYPPPNSYIGAFVRFMCKSY